MTPFLSYENRLSRLLSYQWPSHIQIVNSVKCNSNDHLQNFLKNITLQGGEGVILREPNSLYKTGRSNSLKRFKVLIKICVFCVFYDNYRCIKILKLVLLKELII